MCVPFVVLNLKELDHRSSLVLLPTSNDRKQATNGINKKENVPDDDELQRKIIVFSLNAKLVEINDEGIRT